MDISKMRDFTEDEKEKYRLSLKQIYKDTGVNIFEMVDNKDKTKIKTKNQNKNPKT